MENGPRVRKDATLREALASLLVAGVGWVAVTDEDDKPLGVLTATDIATVVRDATPSD